MITIKDFKKKILALLIAVCLSFAISKVHAQIYIKENSSSSISTLFPSGSDGMGRLVYTGGPYMVIYSGSRWEIQRNGTLIFGNTTATAPNPPALGTGNWASFSNTTLVQFDGPNTIALTTAPTVTTTAATAVTSTSAILNGKVNDGGAVTAATFEYSNNPSLSSGVSMVTATPNVLSAGAGNTNVSYALTTSPGITYYYRVVGANSVGITKGDILNFTAPTTISSISAVNETPTNRVGVQYTVSFSSAVTGVNTSNFSLATTGITGASITSISGSGRTYTVNVWTGSGEGTLKLVMTNASGITQAIANLPYTDGPTYAIDKILPVIVAQPESVTACSGTNTSFSVNATGTDLNYQWQASTGGNFVDLTDANGYSNSKTSTLNIAGVSTSQNGYTFRCVVSRVGGLVYSQAATLSVSSMSIGTLVWNTACKGGSTGSITLIPTSGTAPYTYLWDNGATTATLSNLAAGSYHATVTDSKGCTASTVVTVTEPTTALSATTEVINVACNGGNTGAINLIPIGGIAPYTFDWGNGITTEDRTMLTAGTYSVTITDANRCAVTVTGITVTQPSALVATEAITNVSTPGGNNGAITITAAGGSGGYTYNWNDGITTKDRTNLTAGTYSVTITDANSCTKVVNAIITEPQSTIVDAISRASVNPTMQATVDYTVTFAASVTGVDATDFELVSTGTATGTVGTPTGSGATWTVPITNISGDGTLKLNFTGLTGVTPNISSAFTSGETYTVDNTSPTIVSVTGVDGTYELGDEVLITVHFSEAVKLVSGSPLLTMAVGGNATYQSGNGTDAFVFKYIVAQDVESNDLDYYHEGSFVGGSISDLADNPIIRALPARAATGSLSANANIRIDAKGPGSPSNLTATVGNLKTILTWNPSSEPDLAAYKVYGGTSANPTMLLQTITDGAVTFTHSGLVDGTTYFYRIAAVDDLGNEGAASDDVTSVAQTLSANANLSNLTLSLGSLTPGFDSNTTNYSLSVGKNISTLSITPTQDGPYATTQVRINAGLYATVVSGNPSASLSLNEGPNPIEVLVTAQDGSIKTYTITITRAGLGTPLTDHVVISEIYPSGGGSGALYDRDWVELYNPTNTDINLANHWLLYSGVTGSNLGAKIALSGVIPKHGYYLIAPAIPIGEGAALPHTPDASGTLLMSNTAGRVALVNTPSTSMPQPNSPEVIDFVGYGNNVVGFEGTRAVPPNRSSLERKAVANADATTMAIGGADEFKGNGYDSNNNGVDFVLSTPNPQYISSAVEALVTGNGPTAVALTSGSINENVTAGTTVATLNSTDADAGDLFTYTLVSGSGDTDNAAFTISGEELKINNSPDFETKASYNIRIRTTDALGLYYEKDFIITINDVTELPQITIAGNLTATTAVYGNASASQTFTVSGANMSEGIVITPPTGFELSLDNTTFTPTVTIGAAGTIADAPIYIRLSASANAGSYGGDILATSTGATTATLNMPSSEVKLSKRFVTMTGAGSKDGSSWANASNNLVQMLAQSTAGSEVWVAKGTYKPISAGIRDVYFNIKDGSQVYGGFAGTESALSERDLKANLTILSGDIGAPDVSTDNSYHVVVLNRLSSSTTLDGFTITGANANGPSNTVSNIGAGLLSIDCHNVILKNLIITKNTAGSAGGGLCLISSVNGSNFTATNVSLIQNNTVIGSAGGGIYVQGNAVTTVNFNRCIFDSNTALNTPESTGSGGGLQVSAPNAIVSLNNCLFVNNHAGGTSDDAGGAIMNYGGTINLINSTLFNNTTASTTSPYGNSISNANSLAITNLTNTVVWGDAAKHINNSVGTINYTNSLVKGQGLSSPNLDTDPLFKNAASLAGTDGILGTADDGLQLRYSSPAKNAGTTSGAPSIDIAGTARPIGTGIDLGAYESSAPQPIISATALSGLSATYGAEPVAGSFTLSGAGMDEAVTVTAPTNFEVSINSANGFADAITIGSAGEISTTTIYVRLKSGLAVHDYAGDVVLSSLGATSKNVAATCTVAAAPLTIAAGDVTKTYGQTLTNGIQNTAFTATGLINGESIGSITVAYGTGAAPTDGVGTYAGEVNPSAATGGTFNPANYNITYTAGTLTVNPAAITITASNATKTYGQSLNSENGSIAFTRSGMPNGETIGTVTINYGAGANAAAVVDSYPGSIIPSAATGGTFSSSNYTITYEAGDLTVRKADLTITANHVNKAFGQTLTSGSSSTAFTTSGLQNEENIASVTLTYETGADASAAAGTYIGSVVPSAATGDAFDASNYTIDYIRGNIIVVAPTIVLDPTTLPSATVVVGYSQSITASGGTPNYAYSITAGALPPGLVLAANGTLSGTPTTAGTFIFTVTATDSSTGTGAPFAGSRAYSLTVAAPTISIGPLTLSAAAVGTTYNQSITASGGTPNYIYSVTAGALPPGLVLAANGTLSGTPTTAGTFNFTVTATDSSTGTGAPFAGSRAYSLTVAAPTISIGPSTLSAATVGTSYSQSITASGGTPNYAYSVTAGALPPGLVLAANGTLSGTATAGGAFNFTVTATDSSTGTGAPFAGSRAYSLTVAAPTISIGPSTLSAGAVGNSYSQSITASGGTPNYAYSVTAGALPPGLVLAANGILSGAPTLAGTFNFTITATDSSTGLNPYSASRAYTITIASGNQIITFQPITDQTYGVAPITLAAESNSGLPITYSSSNASVATINNNILTIVGAGTTDITAKQLGDDNYTAAVPVVQTLMVNKATASLSLDNLSQTFDGTAKAVTATTIPTELTGLSITYNGNATAPIAAGTYAVVASLNNPNYIADQATGNLVIGKALQAITFAALTDNTFGDAAFDLGATGGQSGNAVTYESSNPSVATISGNTVTIVGAGTTTIKASQAGNGNYNAATDVARTFNVGKASQTITFAALADKSYGDAAFDLNATGGQSGNTVAYTSSDPSVATISGNRVTIVGAGSATITASQAGNANYNAATDVARTLNVGKASQTITFSALADKTFGDATFDLSASGGQSGNAVAYESSNPSVATISGNTVTIVGAGTTTIKASQAGNANYNAATDVAQTLNVGKAGQTITFAALADKTFGDTPFDLNATGGQSGNVVAYESSNTSVAIISGNTVTIVGAGSAIITASQAGNTNYSAATNVSRTLNVGKASQAIIFTALANKTFGDASFDLSAIGGQSGNAVAYESSNPSVATISGSTVTIVGAGSATITASQTGNTNYSAATNVPRTLNVGKASQAITFATLADKTFGDAAFDLGATGGQSGNAVTYESSNLSVATISGNTVTIVGAGTTTIKASQAGNTNYSAATNVSQTLNVGKASQSITFAALTDKTFGDAVFDLNATGGQSRNAVTYTSSDPSVATISGNTVTIVGAGSAIITASQTGNANYSAATNVSRTLTVGKASQAITFAALTDKTFGDVSFDLNATGGQSGNAVTYTSSDPGVATISGNTVTIVGAGTTTIKASQAGNTNYNAATNVSQTLNVGKASQAIIFAALANKTFGDASFDLNATGGQSGNAVTYESSNPSVATISGNTVTIVGAGITTIKASQAGNGNYNAATDVARIFNVGKASQTITFTALADKTFGDAAFDLNATGGQSGNTVAYTSSDPNVATISGNTVTIVGAGSTTITASQTGNANYNAAADVSRTLNVGKASQAITFAALADKTFGDAAFNLSAIGGQSGNAVAYESSNPSVATISGNTVTIVGAGSAMITASQAGNSNYNAATDVARTFNVGKASQTITFAALADKTFGDAAFDLNATGGQSGNAVAYESSNPSVAAISGNTVTIVGAGSAIITASQTGNANYSAATNVSRTLNVGKASQAITFAALADKTFGDAAFDLNATGGQSGNTVAYTSSDPSVATISGNRVTIVGAGSVTITASQVGNANYDTAVAVSRTLTVNQNNKQLTFNPLGDRTYGDAVIALNATGGSGETIVYSSSNTSVATINGNSLSIVGAGSTIITASQAGNRNFTAPANVDQALLVLPKTIIATFTASNKNYDGNTTATITDRNLLGVLTTDLSQVAVNGGTANFVDATAEKNKTVTANGFILTGSKAANYNLASITNTTADIDQKPITITANAQTITYGASQPELTFTVPAGSLIGTDAITGALSRTAGNNAGTYPINLGTLTAGSNYTINFVGADLIINKKLLTITADDKNRLYNMPNPTLTASYSGFVGTERINELTTLPTLATSALTTSPAGSYPIIASGASANNYSFDYVSGTLTIGSAVQAITFAALVDKLSTDAPFTLTASSSAGLAVTYTSSNPTIARIINGNQVEILKAGTVTITASQTGNGNFAAAVPVAQSLRIIDNPAPLINIVSNVGSIISRGETAKLTATGALSYVWSDAAGIIDGKNTATLIVRPSVTTTYTVTGANIYGRTSQQQFTITVNEDYQTIAGTNILSPNGDGKNDRLIIRNLDLYPNNELKIFDRAGRMIFTKKGYKDEFDGTLNGAALTEGTYYYIIDFGKGKGIKKGFITIIRD